MSTNYAAALKHPVFKVASQIISEKGLQAYVIGGFVVTSSWKDLLKTSISSLLGMASILRKNAQKN
jgi:hypothetical protein